jgi:hypothetical protein
MGAILKRGLHVENSFQYGYVLGLLSLLLGSCHLPYCYRNKFDEPRDKQSIFLPVLRAFSRKQTYYLTKEIQKLSRSDKEAFLELFA